MPEKKFIVARNQWCADKLLAKIYRGEISEYGRVLFPTPHAARLRISQMRPVKQEEYSVCPVSFDLTKIKRY